jgi:hypothetical protein
MNKVIVIDGGYYQQRAITCKLARPSMITTYTYMAMVASDLKKLQATLDDIVIIAQDYGSWRKDLDKTYKAQRKEGREKAAPPEWWEIRYKEFNDFYPKIDASCPWHFIKIYKIEADDIASVVCRYYPDKEIILCSSDRDWEMLYQYSNVKIYSALQNKKRKVPKFKEVPNPTGILLEKIQGDKSDNLLTKPSSEAEFERRKTIVNLLELPNHIENEIREVLDKMLPKNLKLEKIPYPTIRERLKKLYLGDKDE